MEKAKMVEIKGKIREAMNRFIVAIPNQHIQDLVKENAFVAGGAIASLARGEDPYDFDIYLKYPTVCRIVANYFLDRMNAPHQCVVTVKEQGVHIQVPHGILKVEAKEGMKYQPIIVTANAISFTDGIQLVTRFCDSADKIADNFDFLHTKGIYDYHEDTLIVPDATEKAILEKKVTYTGSAYPLASLIRTRKFMKRGWNINAGQFLKMAIQISQLDLTDPIVLKEQLVGVDLLHFTGFLEVMEKADLKDLAFDELFDKLFELIDDAFQKNEEEGLTEEEIPNLA